LNQNTKYSKNSNIVKYYYYVNFQLSAYLLHICCDKKTMFKHTMKAAHDYVRLAKCFFLKSR